MFIIGAVCGGWGVGHYLTWKLITGSLAADTGMTISTLERLRSGKETNAVELLEIKLDGDLVGLGAFLTEVSKSRRDPTHIKILKMAKDYRTKFPREMDAATSECIANAFVLLEEHK